MLFGRRLPLPPPRKLPWSLKPLASAETSLSYDAHGRMVLDIRHDLVKGLTPAMVAWWFRNIGGDMEVEGRRVNRYMVWHPEDHIRWELHRPGPDGGASAGAQFRIVEAFGRDQRFYIDVIDTVTRLDESGFTGVSYMLGQEVARLNHDFTAVEGGTRYVSRLTIGSGLPVAGSLLNWLVHRAIFPEAMGRAWLKHNVEEVGLLEEIVPRIYVG